MKTEGEREHSLKGWSHVPTPTHKREGGCGWGGVWVELGPRVTCGDCGVFPGMMTVETSRTRRLIVEQHLLVGVLNHKPQSRRLQAWREVLEFKDASSARVRPEP